MKNFVIQTNTNNKTKKTYPRRIHYNDGRIIPIPSQHKFKSDYIQKHGCSLAAFYMAMRFIKIKTSMGKCKRYLDKYYGLHGHAKYSILQVAQAINKWAPGEPATFYKNISTRAMDKALKRGDMVLFEERQPIHTAVLLWDGTNIKRFSDGTYKTVTLKQEINKRCGDKYYGGAVIISIR